MKKLNSVMVMGLGLALSRSIVPRHEVMMEDDSRKHPDSRRESSGTNHFYNRNKKKR